MASLNNLLSIQVAHRFKDGKIENVVLVYLNPAVGENDPFIEELGGKFVDAILGQHDLDELMLIGGVSADSSAVEGTFAARLLVAVNSV